MTEENSSLTARPQSSPLLHGQKTGTPLDLITERLYFIWPLSQSQIEWLNTPVTAMGKWATTYPFWINYWSFTHVGWGVIWAALRALTGQTKLFSLTGLLIFHTVFEVWELWAGGYIMGGPHRHRLDLAEWVDIIMDTIFSAMGFIVARMIFKSV